MDPAVVFLFFLVLVLLSVPVAPALGLTAIIASVAIPDPESGIGFFTFSLAEFIDSPSLISIPLFALAGEMAVAAGIADRLIAIAKAVFSPRRSGHGLIAAALLFACISGVGAAAAACLGAIFVPAILREGVEKKRAAGLLSVSGSLALAIPASIPLTLFAAVAGIHTNHLFTASFVPGLLLALALALAWLFSGGDPRRNGTAENKPPSTWAVVREAKWAIFLPLSVLTALFTGFLNAPEAAAWSAACAACIGRFAYKAIDNAAFWRAMKQAGLTASAALLHSVPATEEVRRHFASTLLAWSGGPGMALAVSCAILLVASAFFDPASMVVIFAPVFLPLTRLTGMSPIHLGVVMVFCLAIGQASPLEGRNNAVAADLAGIGRLAAFRGALPFIAAALAVLAAVASFPRLSSFFPSLFGWPG